MSEIEALRRDRDAERRRATESWDNLIDCTTELTKARAALGSERAAREEAERERDAASERVKQWMTSWRAMRDASIEESERAERAEAELVTLREAASERWDESVRARHEGVAAALRGVVEARYGVDMSTALATAREVLASDAPSQRAHTVTAKFEDGWITTTMECPFDLTDETRPCWPRNDCGEPESEAADFCNWKEWFDNGGPEAMREHTLGSWPVEAEWDGDAMWFAVLADAPSNTEASDG